MNAVLISPLARHNTHVVAEHSLIPLQAEHVVVGVQAPGRKEMRHFVVQVQDELLDFVVTMFIEPLDFVVTMLI